MNIKTDDIPIEHLLIFHPKLDEHLAKILKHLYSNEPRPFVLYDPKTGKDVVDFLCGILKTEKKNDDLFDFLKSLTESQKLYLIRMILLDPIFEAMSKSDWNYYGEYIRDWPNILLQLLKFSNISWDKTKGDFVHDEGTSKLLTGFIPSKDFIEERQPEPLYEKLRDEINRAYNYNLPNAVLILSRKLLENLVIDLLRAKFPSNHKIYYDTSRKRFLDFSVLISNLNKYASSFGPDEKAISQSYTSLEKLREKANSNAHSLTEITQLSEISNYKINDLVNTFRYLLDLHRVKS